MFNQLEPPSPRLGSRHREQEAARVLLLAELDRLRKRVDQQEHTLTVLTEAVSVLRRGSLALREENRELRLQLHMKGPAPVEPSKEP